MFKRVILLAEDNDMDAELTMTELENSQISNGVIRVRDGEEALDYIYCKRRFFNRDNIPPILILLDLKMPKVTGLEVLKTVKSDPDKRKIPVVVLTSSTEESDLVSSYNLGVNAYVEKPLKFDQLNSGIKTLGLFWAVVNEPPYSKEQRNLE